MLKALFLILLLPTTCFAQFTISGGVLNSKDEKPVSNCSVFLANATDGGKTTDAGKFVLRNVKPGKYELVVSAIGYEAYSKTIQITNADITLPDILLLPKTIALTEVTIKFDKNRERNLEIFEEQFLGTSDLAKQCKIINPEILDLEYDDANYILNASSNDFLVIENRALGYKVNYLLRNFSFKNKDKLALELHYEGSILFEKMHGSREQEEGWKDARFEVYKNSIMHFLRSALNDRIEAEGFRVVQIANFPNPKRPPEALIRSKINYFKNLDVKKKDSLAYWEKKSRMAETRQALMHFPLKKDDIVISTSQPGSYALSCDNDPLYICFDEGHHYSTSNFNNPAILNKDVTIINFATPAAFFDSNGGLTDVNSLTYTGAWAKNRVAELLPVNYEPLQNKAAGVDSLISKDIANKFEKFAADRLVEKVYLHLDRPYYAAGDTINFKAYVINCRMHKLSQLSAVLHVDLINPDQKIRQSLKLSLAGGLSWGTFAIPDTLNGGNYRIRAYTQSMLNNQNAAFYEQEVQVEAVKNIKVSERGAKEPVYNSNETPDVQFFPEGGRLVTGVKSKIGFKAVATNGLGISLKGVVIDNDNKQICSFSDTHLGMGYIELQPLRGKTYTAELSFSNGLKKTVELPPAEDKSIVLSVNTSPSNIVISLNADKAFYKENKNKNYTLIVYSAGNLLPFIFKLTSTQLNLTLEKGELHSGIAKFTLFSPSGEPMSERLLFIKNADILNVKVNSDKISYREREPMKISFNASGTNGRPSMGHFSVSIVDEAQVPANENSENTILTNLLLTSDLKGYVERPGYYFSGDLELKNVDLLMLTQGYGCFEWKQILDNNTGKYTVYPPEKSLTLAGSLKTVTGTPVKNGNVTLLIPKYNFIKDTTTDINGNFCFSGLNFPDSTAILLKAKKGDNSNVKIYIDQREAPSATDKNYQAVASSEIPLQTVALMRQKYNENQNDNNRRTSREISLKQVNIKGATTKKKPDLTYSANLNGPGHANFILIEDQLENCMDISCLFGKIPGAISKTGYLYNSRTGERLNLNPPPMAIIIDGSVFSQYSKPFDMLNIKDIHSIEVLESGAYLAIYGSSAMGGALVITTKRGSGVRSGPGSASQGLLNSKFKGFYLAKEFYSPRYDLADSTNKTKDTRTTIFWKPELPTDNEGNATIEYYNSDVKGSYRLVVEGIDNNGNIGRQVFRYKVK